MDETDGLRDTGEREAAAGSIDEGYGEVSEFIDKSSIDLSTTHFCNALTMLRRKLPDSLNGSQLLIKTFGFRM